MHHTPIDLARVTLAVLLMLCGHSASAVELEKAVVMLEAAGDFELAETLAFKLTQEQPEHYHRINFLHKYPDSEFAEIVYAQTWRDVKDSGNMAKLRGFIQVMSAGAHALEALDLLFALFEQESTILGFQEYLDIFPTRPRRSRHWRPSSASPSSAPSPMQTSWTASPFSTSTFAPFPRIRNGLHCWVPAGFLRLITPHDVNGLPHCRGQASGSSPQTRGTRSW